MTSPAKEFCAGMPAEPGTYRWSAYTKDLPDLRLSWSDGTFEWRKYNLPKFFSPSWLVGQRNLEFVQARKLAWDFDPGPLQVVGHPVTHACPYCGALPVLKGVHRSQKFISVGSAPWNFNSFWLSCCKWGDSPHEPDPRELIARRAEVLGVADNLATMVKRLARNHPDAQLKAGAMAYLKKNNLTSPLR